MLCSALLALPARPICRPALLACRRPASPSLTLTLHLRFSSVLLFFPFSPPPIDATRSFRSHHTLAASDEQLSRPAAIRSSAPSSSSSSRQRCDDRFQVTKPATHLGPPSAYLLLSWFKLNPHHSLPLIAHAHEPWLRYSRPSRLETRERGVPCPFVIPAQPPATPPVLRQPQRRQSLPRISFVAARRQDPTAPTDPLPT